MLVIRHPKIVATLPAPRVFLLPIRISLVDPVEDKIVLRRQPHQQLPMTRTLRERRKQQIVRTVTRRQRRLLVLFLIPQYRLQAFKGINPRILPLKGLDQPRPLPRLRLRRHHLLLHLGAMEEGIEILSIVVDWKSERFSGQAAASSTRSPFTNFTPASTSGMNLNPSNLRQPCSASLQSL